MNFVADDMIACTSPGGRSISFVVKGNPAIQIRVGVTWKGRTRPVIFDPSEKNKVLFCEAERSEMAAIGLPTEAYFCNETAIKLKVKFVLARPKKDFQKKNSRLIMRCPFHVVRTLIICSNLSWMHLSRHST
jgi:hypothetical protein